MQVDLLEYCCADIRVEHRPDGNSAEVQTSSLEQLPSNPHVLTRGLPAGEGGPPGLAAALEQPARAGDRASARVHSVRTQAASDGASSGPTSEHTGSMDASTSDAGSLGDPLTAVADIGRMMVNLGRDLGNDLLDSIQREVAAAQGHQVVQEAPAVMVEEVADTFEVRKRILA